MKKTTLLLFNLFFLLFYWGGIAQEYTRLGITSGFTVDVIANGVGPAMGSTTAPIDTDRFSFLSRDFQPTETAALPTVGLPINGLITATNIPALSFQLQPYMQANALRISETNTAGTLIFATQEKMMKMYVLATAGNAGSTPVTFSAKIKFSDNTFQTVTGLQVADWYQGVTASTVITGIGRIDRSTNGIETPANNPKLFSVEINLDIANYTKQVVNVELTKTSAAAGVLNVFAVSAIKSPDCFIPNTVTIGSILANTATINWLAADVVPAIGYEFEVRTAGEAGSGATGLKETGSVGNTILTKNISGLLPSTEYSVYMRSKCTATSFSNWTSVKKFTTMCQFSPLTTTPATVCGRGIATLGASAGGDALKWYDSAVGGNVVGTGSSFTTPLLAATTSYWVSSIQAGGTIGQAGKPEPSTGASASTSNNYGIVFNAAHDITLETVDVYSTGAGTLNIKIVNAAGAEIFSTGNVNIVNGGSTTPNVVSLGFEIPAGNGYKMLIKAYSGANLLRNSSNFTFPYTDPQGIVTVPSSEWGGTTTSYYYYFYNIKYFKGCVSPRTPVVATVTPAPVFTISSSEVSICGGQPSGTLTITSGRESFDSYVWSPSTGVTGNAQNGWVFNATEGQVYTLTATQTAGQRCQVVKQVEVKVRPTPVVTYLPEDGAPPVCITNVVPLEVLYESEKTTQVGADVSTSFNSNLSAFNNYRSSGRVQMLFTAQELRALGLMAGPINSVAFFVSTLGANANNTDYNVKIAPTNLVSFADANFITTGFTIVFTAATYTHTASGWQEINFDTAYEWDGVKNLIIELDHKGTNSSSSASTNHTVTATNSVLFGYNSGSAELSKNRFNVKLKQIFPYKVTWTASGPSLFIDAAGTMPYLAGGNVRKIYYRPQISGVNEVEAMTTLGNCTTTKVFNVTTSDIPKAQVEATQSFCGQARVSNLVANGQNLKWYTTAVGGAVLGTEVLLVAGDYYVSQTVDGCESLTKKTTVSFLSQPAIPQYTPRAYCGTTYLNDLEVQYDLANTLNWYDSANNLISSNILLRSGVYYLSQSNTACESERLMINISANPVPAVPSASPLIKCGQAKVSDLNPEILPGATANWYLNENSNMAMTSNELLSTRTYYLSQTLNSCESDRVAVSVSVYAAVPMPVAQNQNFCTTNVRVANLDATTVTGAIAIWYNTASGGIALLPNQLLTTGLYYVSQKIGDCESPRARIGVNVVENSVAPIVAGQYFCGSAAVSQLRANVPVGMIAKWYTQEFGGTALLADLPLQSGWYYVSQSLYGCESPRRRVEVVVGDIPQQPTGNPIQEFVTVGTVADLNTNQSNVIWFGSLLDASNNRNALLPSTSLVDGMIYYGIIISQEGCFSMPFAVTVKIKTLGINDFDLKQLTYFPNPVSDVLSITYKDLITKVEVYSLTGQLVTKVISSDYNVKVDMNDLARASYLVKIYTASQSQTIKVIKK